MSQTLEIHRGVTYNEGSPELFITLNYDDDKLQIRATTEESALVLHHAFPALGLMSLWESTQRPIPGMPDNAKPMMILGTNLTVEFAPPEGMAAEDFFAAMRELIEEFSAEGLVGLKVVDD